MTTEELDTLKRIADALEKIDESADPLPDPWIPVEPYPWQPYPYPWWGIYPPWPFPYREITVGSYTDTVQYEFTSTDGGYPLTGFTVKTRPDA